MTPHQLMKNSTRRTREEKCGFTLIELLTVVAIITILLVATVPSMLGAMNSTRIGSAGSTLMGMLSQAQQLSSSQNVPVEVRFYRYPTLMDATPQIRAYQLFKISSSPVGVATETTVGLGVPTKIPDSLVIANDPGLSPCLAGGDIPDTDNFSGVAGAVYTAIRFMPDGSCRRVGATAGAIASLTYQTLPESFMTIVEYKGVDVTAGTLPPDFYTVQIDPFTGKARNYRPGF